LWLKKVDDKSEIWSGQALGVEKQAYLIGTIDAPISSVKTKRLSDDTIAFCFISGVKEGKPCKTYREKSDSSAREYEVAYVRFWDAYVDPVPSTLWYATMKLKENSNKWKLEGTPMNALEGTKIIVPFFPDGTGDDYEISTSGILLTPVDPINDPARLLVRELCYIPLDTFTESPKFQKITVPGWTGDASSAVFSPDGKSAAFTKIYDPQNTGNTTVFLIRNMKEPTELTEVNILNADGEFWDHTPDALLWSADKRSLYVLSGDQGRNKLFQVPINGSTDIIQSVGTRITSHGCVNGVQRAGQSSLLCSISTMHIPMIFQVLNTESTKVTSSYSAKGAWDGLELSDKASPFGILPQQVSEFYVQSEDRRVQSWIVKPSNFDASKKYPVAYLIHGGPESAWSDAWSTRWNPILFAEQGYIVILPNPAGSTGWGLEFRKAVRGEWGGKTYRDIVKVWEYAKAKFDFLDISRAVALGASFGGYMMYWIMGQPLGKEFQAIVSHDGVFSMIGMMGCDVPYQMDVDLGAELWEDMEVFDKWDPARFTKNWETPLLVIHSDKDYRCPMVDGLAAYAVCKRKGIPARFLNFPDENHWVLKRANSLHWQYTVLGWINKYAKVEGGVILKPALNDFPIVEKKEEAEK
jgi:dipeptidyl aminopeptidase/acylaminoacyl peptidase